MTFTDTTPLSQADTASFEIELAHPPEKVWRALTDPELLTQWLLPVVEHQFHEGGEFRLQAPVQPGWDGSVSCRYLEIEAPSKLRWAWVVGELDTIVSVTLTATPSGTRMTLAQSGFKPHQKQNFGGARYGWKMMSGRLGELLEKTP
ncbi:MAG: SRPBCC domain-containing protein [Polyangiaceae bacterium]